MKIIFTLIVSLIFFEGGYACGYSPRSFCEMISVFNDNILYGRVIEHNTSSIRFEVLNILRGQESRDTITVWDNQYECMGINMLPANVIGQVGDTALISVSIIDSLQNPWDVLGDYRIPNHSTFTYFLSVENDTLKGLVKGAELAPRDYQLWEISLFDFLSNWDLNSNCDALRVGVQELSELQQIGVYPNPTTDNLNIKNLPTSANVELLSLNGQVINTFEKGASQLFTAHLAVGTYLLKINYQGETGFRRIVKL